ncbi:MAG: hypothetical protein KAK00_09085 [Nanoarchaeota archaeon]|nr:hypothetical protein [Nanoarchaeota archaeon]
MNHRAQNVGQIFTYIVTIVIIAVILLFGYNAIRDFKQKADQISMVDFQNNLESSIKSIEYGSLRNKVFTLSNDYKEVCFVNNHNTDDYGDYDFDVIFKDYPIIRDVVESGTRKNIFLIKDKKEVAEKFEIGKISFSGDSILKCFDVINSKLSIAIEGKGNHVIIS